MIRSLITFTCVMLFAITANADELERSRIDLEAKKKVAISNAMVLSADQSDKFWDVYSDYERDSGRLTRQGFTLIREYSDKYKNNTITEESAASLIEAYFELEAHKVQLKRDYLPKFSEFLPAKKVFHFYQIDNKIDSLIRCDIAKKLPLIEPDMEF